MRNTAVATKIKCMVFGLAAILTFTACDQKELCLYKASDAGDTVSFLVTYDRKWQITYPGAIDWETAWDNYDFGMSYNSLLPDIPTGLRVVVYDDESLLSIHNIPADGGKVYVMDDDNSVLMFNNDSEYIVYFGLDTISDASATTRRVQRSTYQGSPYVRNAPALVNPPDMLYHLFIDEVEDVEGVDDGHDDHLKVVMQPVVYTYLIRYRFDHGLDYVAIARGALAGMADEVWLETGDAGHDAATVLYDCELTDWGVQAIVRSFGSPSHSPDQRYGLNLEVRLKNGKILDFNFDVTDQLDLQPKGGVIDVGGVKISDEEGQEETGVFDVTIEGWGEFEDIPISM